MKTKETTTTDPGTRVITKEIVIDAPIEAVWKALTDAEELCNWFPLQADLSGSAIYHISLSRCRPQNKQFEH